MNEVSTDLPDAGLADRWEERGPIPLDGWLERNDFAPLMTAFFGLVAAFVLFQVVLSPIALLVILLAQGVSPTEMLVDVESLIEQHAVSLLTANTVGQIFGLALPAYLLARLHTRRASSFLRLRGSDAGAVVLAVIGLIAITPAIQWLGIVNEHLPLPDFIRGFEESQMEVIERVLSVDTGFAFNLVVLAITPAICEELLFRGYVQRQGERSLGIAGGILFSGVIFGLYHLRLTQAIPLSVLGTYLAWLVWRTGSLWPAVVVHFANNAIAVAVGAYIARDSELDVADLEQLDVPWYLVLLGLMVFAAAVLGIHRAAERTLRRRRGLERSTPADRSPYEAK